jgi:hypothetical protein
MRQFQSLGILSSKTSSLGIQLDHLSSIRLTRDNAISIKDINNGLINSKNSMQFSTFTFILKIFEFYPEVFSLD